MTAARSVEGAVAAEMLGVSLRVIGNWTDQGLLRSTTSPGGRRQFALADLAALVLDQPLTVLAEGEGRQLILFAAATGDGSRIERWMRVRKYLTARVEAAERAVRAVAVPS